LEALLARTRAETVDHVETWQERLASRPTAQRRLLALAAVPATAAMWWAMMGVRADFPGEAMFTFSLNALPLAVAGVVAQRVVLRDETRRAPHRGWLASTLLLPSFLAVALAWPGMHTEHGAPLSQHLMCGMAGVMYGMVAAAATVLLTRDRADGERAIWTGAMAGSLAFVVQNVVCPLVDADHLLFAHGAAVLPLTMAAAALTWLAGRRTAR
jgi:hypothetical protein